MDLLKDVKICEARCHILSLRDAKELTDFQLVQAPWPSTRPSVVNLVQLDITLARLWLWDAMGKAQQMLKRCATERLLEIGNRKEVSRNNMKQLHLFTSLYISLSSCFSLFFDFGFLNVSEQSSLKVDKFDGVSRVFMWSWSALCSAGSCSQERQHMYLESSRVVLKA